MWFHQRIRHLGLHTSRCCHQPSPTVHVADMTLCSVFINRHQPCTWQTWLCAQCSSAATNSAGGRHGCVLSVHQPSPTVQVADMAVCSVFINRHQPCTWQTWLCAECSSAATNSAGGRIGCVLSVHQPSPTVQVADMAVCSVFISRHQQCRWQTWLCAQCSSAVTNSAGGRHGCVLSVHQPSPTVQVVDMAVCSVFINRHQPCRWQTWLCAQCSSAATNSAGGRHGCVLSVHQPSPTVQVADMAVCSVFISRHQPCTWQTWLCAECSSAATNSAGGRHGCVLSVHQPSPTVQVADMAVCSVFISRHQQCRWQTWLCAQCSSAVTNSAGGRHGCVLSVHQPSPTVQVADMAVCSVFISRHQQCRWQTWLCAECSSAVTNSAGGRHGCVLSVHQPSPTVQVVDMAVC